MRGTSPDRGTTQSVRRRRLSAGRGRRGSGVLDREDHDAVGLLVVLVDEEHPPPRAEQKPEARPPAGQLRPEPGELRQRGETATETVTGVARKAEHDDQPIEILDGCAGKFDTGQRLQVLERHRVTCGGLLAAERCALPRLVDAVQDSNDRVGVWISVVDG